MRDDPGQTGAGKHIRPWHAPFTHFPIAAYVIAAAFDVISVAGGSRHTWAGQLWHAGTFVLIAGLVACLATMFTGFVDLVRFSDVRPGVVRHIAAHVCVMAAVFMIGVGDITWRLTDLNRPSTPPGILILTVAAAIGVCAGGYLGGTLVYKHGVGVGVTAARTARRPDPADAEALADARTPAADLCQPAAGRQFRR